ncbi:Six-hairpin glycosidase [Mycena sanguinolenta]|uniref:Six-hairpin glycosidase n=1 Tax=Mycena sanguinolenta TaxID=230812 RepID=A0A8H7DFT9_9AGAR|nr:Six-hairpin glycosidase [Mycena sanguinolenta]
MVDPRRDDLDGDIGNRSNLRYTAALTIGGQTLNVTLDTGSTDLWVNPQGGVGAFENTGVAKHLTYGGGAFINGTVGLAEITVAGHTIPHQAFINVTQISSGLNTCASGLCGLLGLGFDSPTAGIEEVLAAAGLDGPGLGKSVLSSIFDMNPDKGRFFAIISEYDSKYSSVQWLAKHPVYPPGAKSWHILSDGASVNGISVPWAANSASTPAGQHLIALDTGTPNFLVPADVRDAIYGFVPGAVLAKNTKINSPLWRGDRDLWIVPCSTPVSFTAIFGLPYPIHPLDMTEMATQTGPDGVKYTYCYGAVTSGGSLTNGTTDALFGDSFLRNVYTVFSFGDNNTAPFVQLLPLTNEWDAAQDFARVRQQQLSGNVKEIAPADLIRIFDGQSNSSPSSTGNPSSSTSVAAGHLVEAAAVTSGTDTPVASKYMPVIIGLLAANLFVVLVLAVLGVMLFVRRSRTVGSSSARYAPVKVKDDSFFAASYEDRPYSDS